jgi:hypothetical protein
MRERQRNAARTARYELLTSIRYRRERGTTPRAEDVEFLLAQHDGLRAALIEAEWKLRESKPHRDTLLPCNSEFVMGVVADDIAKALAG